MITVVTVGKGQSVEAWQGDTAREVVWQMLLRSLIGPPTIEEYMQDTLRRVSTYTGADVPAGTPTPEEFLRVLEAVGLVKIIKGD